MQRFLRWLRFNWMYLGKPPWETGISPPELHEFIRQHPPGFAIDLGCGSGTNLLTLARAGWQTAGVDFALQAVRNAQRKLRRAGYAAYVRAGDVTRLENLRFQELPDRYDLVLDIGCYHGLPAPGREAYRANLLRILKSGGCFLMYANWRKGEAERTAWGIGQEDIDALSGILNLRLREDSQDRWERRASWLCFSLEEYGHRTVEGAA